MAETATKEREEQVEQEAAGTALEARRDEAALTAPNLAMSDHELNRCFRIARALASSNMFKDARQAEQAFAKILIGRDLGLSPTEAMTNIHIIEGKPELSANLHAAKVKQAPGYDYKVARLDAEAAVIEFYANPDETVPRHVQENLIGVSEFSIEDAKTAKLEQKTGPNASEGTFKRYPRNMLFARAMTNGVAWYCPEVMGSLRVYAVGEVAEMEGEQSQAEAAGAYDWSVIEDADVQERLRGAVETANELEPNSWPPAKCEMTFTGRPAAHLSQIAGQIEARNAELIRAKSEAEPPDAEVVEEGEGESGPPAAQEGTQEEERAAPDPEAEARIQGLRQRYADLTEQRPLAQSEDQEREIADELEKIAAELADLGGEVPGQSSLDL